jgi:hypothetical protein
LTGLLFAQRRVLRGVRAGVNFWSPEPEAAMDETGMSDADKIEFVDDVLRTWGEEAAQEVAERYAVDLEALKRGETS